MQKTNLIFNYFNLYIELWVYQKFIWSLDAPFMGSHVSSIFDCTLGLQSEFEAVRDLKYLVIHWETGIADIPCKRRELDFEHMRNQRPRAGCKCLGVKSMTAIREVWRPPLCSGLLLLLGCGGEDEISIKGSTWRKNALQKAGDQKIIWALWGLKLELFSLISFFVDQLSRTLTRWE